MLLQISKAYLQCVNWLSETNVNAALFKFRSLYRVQFLAGHDRAVEKQEYVIAVDVVSIKKGSTKCTPNNAPILASL